MIVCKSSLLNYQDKTAVESQIELGIEFLKKPVETRWTDYWCLKCVTCISKKTVSWFFSLIYKSWSNFGKVWEYM